MTKVHGRVKESLTDDWTKQEDAHRKMPSSWIGETIFTANQKDITKLPKAPQCEPEMIIMTGSLVRCANV
jgi:hypothetical protein